MYIRDSHSYEYWALFLCTPIISIFKTLWKYTTATEWLLSTAALCHLPGLLSETQYQAGYCQLCVLIPLRRWVVREQAGSKRSNAVKYLLPGLTCLAASGNLKHSAVKHTVYTCTEQYSSTYSDRSHFAGSPYFPISITMPKIKWKTVASTICRIWDDDLDRAWIFPVGQTKGSLNRLGSYIR